MERIEHDLEAIKSYFNKLNIEFTKEHCLLIGNFNLNAMYNNVRLEGHFNLQIKININTYTKSIPTVIYLDNSISKNFHKNSNNNLCLGTNVEQELIFSKNPTIKGFIENLLIPYLFSYLYWVKYNEVPFGERSHGIYGIYEFYVDYFDNNNIQDIINLLEISIYYKRTKNKINVGQKHLKKIKKLINVVDINLLIKDLKNLIILQNEKNNSFFTLNKRYRTKYL